MHGVGQIGDAGGGVDGELIVLHAVVTTQHDKHSGDLTVLQQWRREGLKHQELV